MLLELLRDMLSIMTNLFIIGNGFDLAHGMKTRYTDFRQFLIDNYLYGSYEPYSFVDVPTTTLMPDGDEQYNETDVVKSILSIIDNAEGVNWSDVETSLADLAYETFLDDYDFYDKEDDNYIRDTFYRNYSLATSLCGALEQIDYYFQEWISQIDIAPKINLEFKKVIDIQNDLFLTFNYTNTLQRLYQVKNVCHIHGKAEENLFFGHGDNECPKDYYEKNWFGAQDSLENLFFSLKKDTENAYNKNKSFFENIKISAIEKPLTIYSYGFSFSLADRYYLKKICDIIDTSKICFYMNNYDSPERRKMFENILRECGFKGTTGEFFI